ncbi:MAG: hypothetical protein HY866_01205 [Chloroflexi bacterium]|nr:hypothetical protein [Chloroflexota bacterium]
MQNEERELIVNAVNQIMIQRAKTQASLSNALKEFSARLFSGLENVLDELDSKGVPGVGKYRRLVHPAGSGMEGFQMFVEDWSVIFVPLLGFARPNPQDEARITTAQFKEPCARIAVFLTDNPQGNAFYDFLIFQDHSWFAWGYGWPKQQSDIENTDFEGLAVDLVHGFISDIFVTWNVRDTTSLTVALDPKKHPYIFGLPGEERQSGS